MFKFKAYKVKNTRSLRSLVRGYIVGTLHKISFMTLVVALQSCATFEPAPEEEFARCYFGLIENIAINEVKICIAEEEQGIGRMAIFYPNKPFGPGRETRCAQEIKYEYVNGVLKIKPMKGYCENGMQPSKRAYQCHEISQNVLECINSRDVKYKIFKNEK